MALISIKDRKLLLAFSKNKQAWYLPGGKIDAGESSLEALVREIREELQVSLLPDDVTFYYHASVPALGEKGAIMEQDCFRCLRSIEPQASAEIGAIKYFDQASYLRETRKAHGALFAFEKLKTHGLVD